jgi:hypothetical protein
MHALVAILAVTGLSGFQPVAEDQLAEDKFYRIVGVSSDRAVAVGGSRCEDRTNREGRRPEPTVEAGEGQGQRLQDHQP